MILIVDITGKQQLTSLEFSSLILISGFSTSTSSSSSIWLNGLLDALRLFSESLEKYKKNWSNVKNVNKQKTNSVCLENNKYIHTSFPFHSTSSSDDLDLKTCYGKHFQVFLIKHSWWIAFHLWLFHWLGSEINKYLSLSFNVCKFRETTTSSQVSFA